MDLKQLISQKIKEEVVKIAPEFNGDVLVEIPKEKAHGDYSVNIAMQLARTFKQSPMTIATKLVDAIGTLPEFKKIEAVNPGFINFYVDEKVVFVDILDKALVKDFHIPLENPKKVIIEHTSVNPNKAMHVGHLRNAVLGDVLARVYRKLGYRVEVQNYIDNLGLQVADTTNGILNLGLEPKEGQVFDDYCWDVYTEINKRYETDEKLVEERAKISKMIEEGDNEIAAKSTEIVNKIVDCHLGLMARFNILYDLLVYEGDVIKFGFWEQAFEQLKQSPNFYLETEGKQAGCWVLKYDSDKFGNKIFVRSNGTKVYTAKDTAYQLWKFGSLGKDFKYLVWQRQFRDQSVYKTDANGEDRAGFGAGDRVINIIDERQTYPQEMVKHALKSLGFAKEYENYDHLAYGVVSLSPNTAQKLGLDTADNKAAYSMSGRKGVGVKVADLLNLMITNVEQAQNVTDEDGNKRDAIASPEMIAIGALKHYLLKYNPISEVVFDYEEALRLVGNTGPYLQYSFVRASSILEKAGASDFAYDLAAVEISESEDELIKLIGRWTDVLKDTLKDNYVSVIPEYAFQLSAAFHSFYEKNNVLKSEEQVKRFRLAIIKAYANVISEVLEVMGIESPEHM